MWVLNKTLTAALLACAVAAPAQEFFVYFGTYTNSLSRGIYVSRLDAATGALSKPELAAEVPNPCYLNFSPDHKFLYSANSRHFNGTLDGSVSAFSVNAATGQLTPLNEVSAGDQGPCHVSVDASGKTLFVANYGGGSVKSFRLNPDGSLGAAGSFVQFHGSSVNADRQTASHAHYMGVDPTGRFALVCDLGRDKISIFPLQPATAALDLDKLVEVSVPAGGGARHLDFSRDGNFFYVANEMACSVTTFAWNHGQPVSIETISLLPENVSLKKNFTAAEIRVHPAGKFVYATLRGHDSVSVLAADANSGRLKLIQNLPSGGKTPRGLGIDPTGRWLLAGNQNSDKVVEFSIATETGALAPTGIELKVGSPVDVNFAPAR